MDPTVASSLGTGADGSFPGGAIGAVIIDGEPIRHVSVGHPAKFDISAPGCTRDDLEVSVTGPAKQQIPFRLLDSSLDPTIERGNNFRVEFTGTEVGTYLIDVATNIGGKVTKAVGSPFLAKVYDAALIRVSDPPNGVVGSPCQFRVDASQAGEGQLEISICDGEVPNHVQVLGGGRCLVSFIPEKPMEHNIDIKFNGDTVPGCPFFCQVTDTSRVKVNLRHLELIAIDEPASFMIHVDGTTPAELGVSVRAPSQSTLPVKVNGTTRTGFRAEFVPKEVGAHTVLVEYNGTAVAGTPFTAKVYDSKRVYVSPMPKGSIGKPLQFTVDAGQAGEGNLEITISASGRNIPTQVHPQGNARFAVSFVPLEATDHVVIISFNKEDVAGSPFVAHVSADPNRLLVSGQGLASAAVGKPAYFTISNVTGTVEDVEVNVEGPTGSSIPAQLTRTGDGTFLVEFAPRVAGEHRIHVLYAKEAVPGSPFSCKVYDVGQIKVRESTRGVVGRPVTFLVETSQAGPGNLEVTVNQGQVPTSAQSQGHHTYAISFTPKEPKPHIVELKFNGEDVPGSPFHCVVLDASRVTASGDGLEKVPVGRPATFYIHSQESGGGDLEVVVMGPTRARVPHVLTPIGGRDGEGDGDDGLGLGASAGSNKYTVEYVPPEVGDHTVEVRYADLPIPGSPFLVKAYDSSKINVTDIGSGVVSKPVYFNIDASHAGAGNLEIIVSVNGRNVPNYVQSEGNAKFKVNFKPQEPAVHLLSVRFNGESVPGSPFSCRVTDSSLVLVSGDGLKLASVSQPSQFTIDPRGSDIAGCVISIVSPLGKTVPVTLKHLPTGLLQASFAPDEVGPHQVTVTLQGEHLGASPYTCNVYDVNNVKVTGLENSKVGRPITFTVDASEAGEGTLELVVTTAKTSVKAEVLARSRGLYDVTFVPQEPIPHFVNITFNEEEVPGNPFKCEVRDLDAKEMKHLKRTESKMVSVAGDGLREVVVGALNKFYVDTKGMDGEIDVRITGPDEEVVPCRVTRGGGVRSGIASGAYRVEYRTETAGLYRIEVYHKNLLVSKQPFFVEAADPARVKLVNIEDGVVGKDSTFKVDASKAGRGTLTITIKAASQEVKHSLRDTGWGSYDVVYTPMIAVPHKITVKYNGVNVSGSPVDINVKNPYSGKVVTASGLGLHQSRVGKPTTFVIETLGHIPDSIDVWVTGPSGSAVPVKCYQQKDGNLLAEFNASMAGAHKIEVMDQNAAIHGSPFTCQVYDAAKVRIEELKQTTFSVNDRVAFKIDRRRAGIAELNVTVSSPVGKNLPIEVKPLPDGRGEQIEFSPPAAGKYKIAVTYGDDEVPGSPVTFTVEEEGWARAYGDGLSRGRVGAPASFKIDAQGLIGDPHVVVDGPDSVAKTTVELDTSAPGSSNATPGGASSNGGTYVATYTSQEVGVFDVTVQWNGKELPGSPFHPKIVDPRKVRVIGGWEALMTDDSGRIQLLVNQETRVSFDVSEAGPGKLRAEVKYGGKDEEVQSLDNVKVEQTSPSRYRMSFTPVKEGEHFIYLYWLDYAVPKTPVVGYAEDLGHPVVGVGAANGSADHNRVVLKGHGLQTAKCGEEAEFVIDGSAVGSGSPEVSLTGIKADIKVHVNNAGNGVYRATYTPTIPGAYLLNVTWAGRQVKSCPLKVNVIATTDSNKVLVSGEGVKGGVVGRDIRSFIDTRRAGPGELTAHCSGPNKVAYCELYDHGDGTFILNVKPQEAGKHSLTIKYGGEHVPGSPFMLKISGAPDPSKVRVYGPGIEPGVLANFQSRFICDTRGAGAGQLTVRIRGPKAAFRVEMHRDGQKDRCISCRYSPTEPGDYRVEVKWSAEHVPGSPFMVMIFDTQEELQRYLHDRRSQSPGQSLIGGPPGSGMRLPPGGPGSEYYGSVAGFSTYAPLSVSGLMPGMGPMSPTGSAMLPSPSWRGSQPHL